MPVNLGTPEYNELKKKLIESNRGAKYAHDPMFAPVTYGDDRQVCRTRRGIHCQVENNYNPLLVYCKCLSCKYQWIMDKAKYVAGTGTEGNRPNPMHTHQIGVGGTGIFIGNFPNPAKGNQLNYNDRYPTLPSDISCYFDYDAVSGKFYKDTYGKYNVLAHDTSHCKETTMKCEDGLMHVCDFYPLTGGTGENGEIEPLYNITDLSYDPVDGPLVGDKNSIYLGPAIPVYESCTNDLNITNHPGGSGTYGGATFIDPNTGLPTPYPLPRTFGGHPMACPNCCKTNFIAKWIELNDRPYPYINPDGTPYEHVQPSDIPSDPLPNPELGDFATEYLPWVYANKLLLQIDVTTAASNWFFDEVISTNLFKTHVSLLVFDEHGNVIPEKDIKKIYIDHISGTCRIVFDDARVGYIWILKPKTDLGDYIDNIDNVCTAVIVRDLQRIKSHFNLTS